jgi:excisionase family DNA binding protein
MTVNDLAKDVSEPLGIESQGWRDDSLCRKHPTQWWFAGGHSDTSLAKSICSGCVVQKPCLDFALSRPDLLGIWAATTPTERAALRREGRDRFTLADPELAPEIAAPVDVAPVDVAPVDVAPVDVAPVDVEPAVDVPVAIDLVVEQARESKRELEALPKRSAGRGPRRGWRDGAPIEYAELLTPAEAARKLGVTPNTVTRWSRAGKISAIQTMGGHRRFRRSEIERVLRDASLSTTNPY